MISSKRCFINLMRIAMSIAYLRVWKPLTKDSTQLARLLHLGKRRRSSKKQGAFVSQLIQHWFFLLMVYGLTLERKWSRRCRWGRSAAHGKATILLGCKNSKTCSKVLTPDLSRLKGICRNSQPPSLGIETVSQAKAYLLLSRVLCTP